MEIEFLLTLLEEKRFPEIRQEIEKQNSVDLANLLSEIDDDKDLVMIFRMIPKQKASEVFSYMDNDRRMALIDTFGKQEITNLFDSMFADDAVDFIEDMPANVVSKLLEDISRDKRTHINNLLKYDDDSAGSLMTVEFVELRADMTVSKALEKIRKTGIKSETIYTCYVVEKHKLKGIITAKDLLINDENAIIGDLMEDNFIYVSTTDDRETVGSLFRKYGFISIPVLDSESCIVGIVTFDDAIDVITEEATEDMQKMAAMAANDEPYLKTSVWKHAKHRIVWLLILMLSATITGAIIEKYENAILIVPLLVSFIPMLMDTGGNCGSQSSTLIIRGLAVGELSYSDIFKILWKEFRVSLIVSGALSIANGLRIYLMYRDIRLSLVVSLSLIIIIVSAKIIGCTLPIIAKKIHLDPAIMAAPLITTIVDAISIFIYFSFAMRIFDL